MRYTVRSHGTNFARQEDDTPREAAQESAGEGCVAQGG